MMLFWQRLEGHQGPKVPGTMQRRKKYTYINNNVSAYPVVLVYALSCRNCRQHFYLNNKFLLQIYRVRTVMDLISKLFGMFLHWQSNRRTQKGFLMYCSHVTPDGQLKHFIYVLHNCDRCKKYWELSRFPRPRVQKCCTLSLTSARKCELVLTLTSSFLNL